MSSLALALAYLRQRPAQTLLNVVLLALGIATVAALLLAGRQAERSLARGAERVDFVVGAKGSPLQLILSAVYHLDSPTGNIPHALLDSLRAHRAVAEAIPLALGDAYEGWRVAGTEPDYVALYEGTLAEGRLWEATGEAVLGARVAAATGLGVGSTLVTTHGLGGGDDASYAHDDAPLRVVGVLAPGAGVLDALVLTDVGTVWDVHGLGLPPDEHAADEHAADEHA
ncbi:MAG: ABC transporter permease, partial [Rubricoccaceae bacterium]